MVVKKQNSRYRNHNIVNLQTVSVILKAILIFLCVLSIYITVQNPPLLTR